MAQGGYDLAINYYIIFLIYNSRIDLTDTLTDLSKF